MSILRKLQAVLDSYQVPLEVLPFRDLHGPRNSRGQRIPGDKLAKVVIVKKENGTPVMLVLPASYHVNFSWLREVLGTHATLEEEREFRGLFPECEIGAEPPFSTLFDLDTAVDTSLTTDDEIIFNPSRCAKMTTRGSCIPRSPSLPSMCNLTRWDKNSSRHAIPWAGGRRWRASAICSRPIVRRCRILLMN